MLDLSANKLGGQAAKKKSKIKKDKRKGDTRASPFLGGRGWIRTTEVADDRFTVCSLWPLGNPSVLSFWQGSG